MVVSTKVRLKNDKMEVYKAFVLTASVSILFKLAIVMRVSLRTISPVVRVCLPHQMVSVIKAGLRMVNSMEKVL